MKFSQLLSNLILEQSRFQVLYDKMVKPAKGTDAEGKKAKGLMDFETLKAIILADPTTTVPQGEDIDTLTPEKMENVKVGKYTQWMLKNYVMPSFKDERDDVEKGTSEYKQMMAEHHRLFMEDLFKLTDDLKKFNTYKQYFDQDKRDINKFTPDSLFTYLESQKEMIDQRKQKTEKNVEKKEIRKSRVGYAHKGATIEIETPTWTVIKIEGCGEPQAEAASWFGGYYDFENGESRWCTSPPKSSYFQTYCKQGPLYVVLPNDDKGVVGTRTGLPTERYQFHFPSDQFMDRQDRRVNLVELLNGPMTEIKDYFKPEFAKGLVSKGGNKVEVNYPDSSAGKFIALYGFEELFESLPETIEHLIISNKSKENIALDVPESITRFKNLDALLMSNIVRTLPENLGDLKNLKFLNLANNKDLLSLPESIKDIPNLALLNLKGVNPNVEIPPALKEVLSDEGEGFYYLI